jgi:tetratricopeptide (TPR) repeat protein
MRQFAEASAAYRKALVIRPGFPAAYLGIALAEASQSHFRVALSNFQQITHIAPKADIGWIGSSACAEKLGMRAESLQYARHATAVAPSSPGAWYQLAREEGLFGDKQAASKALAHATQLQGKTRASKPSR